MKAVITTREQAITVIEIAEHLIGETTKAATELRERKVEALKRYKQQIAARFAAKDILKRSQAYWLKRVNEEYDGGWNSPLYRHRHAFKNSWNCSYRILEDIRDELATLVNHINFAIVKVGEPIHIELSHADLILLDNTIIKVGNRLDKLYEGEF